MLVRNQRSEVIGWLNARYGCLSVADCEDIFQDASWELWKKFQAMKEWNGEPILGLLKVICRNVATHFLKGMVHYEEWCDEYYPKEVAVETDYGFVSPQTFRKMLKEQMYQMIGHLSPKDDSLMTMYLNGMTMKDISRKLGFKTEQASRNRKCKIVARLRKEIADGQAEGRCRNTGDGACPSFLVKCILFFKKSSSQEDRKSRKVNSVALQ